MPLIKPRSNRVKTMRHICRLQEPNRDALVLYARFIGDTADYILNQLIDTTIAKDREFVSWRAEQAAEVRLAGRGALFQQARHHRDLRLRGHGNRADGHALPRVRGRAPARARARATS